MKFFRIALIAAASAIAFTGPAAAQVPPYVYPIALGTSPIQVLPSNAARRKVIFHNPNDTAKVAVCPAGPSRATGLTFTVAINGAGCITILPYDRVEVSGGTPSGPQQSMITPWNGVASAGGSALTIIEFE